MKITFPTVVDNTLLEALQRCQGTSIAVIGDIMLDEYVTGSVDRISPEAPVPVLKAHGREFRLGGAANVAQQIKRLGCDVQLIGVIGADEAGERILEACRRNGIDCSGVHVSRERITTRKSRILGQQQQQLMRLDWEDCSVLSVAERSAVEGAIQALGASRVFIVSDYAKGLLDDAVLSAIASRAEAANSTLIIDPKDPDFTRYRGAAVLTPNLRELGAAANEKLVTSDLEAIARVADRLRRAAGVGSLLVTLGEEGMLLVEGHEMATHIRAAPRAVYDVTGAGDTAVAVFGALLAAGSTRSDAAVVANAAAGVAVGHVGTVAVSCSDIKQALLQAPTQKVISAVEAASKTRLWQSAGKRVVFTNGCFDLLHPGHLSLLHFAKEQGDYLVLAINSDAAVRRLKGPSRPVVSQADRAAMLGAMSCVDVVVIFDEDTPLETLHLLKPDVLVKGADYQLQEVIGRDVVERHGGRVVLAPLLPEHSTSSIIQRLRA